jgi:excisionase family DNA binding protein
MVDPDVPPQDIMSIKEAALYLRIPLPTAYYLVKSGQIPAIRIGARYRVKRSEIDRDVLRLKDDSSPPTALAVDDEPALQMLYKKFLRKANLARVVVGSGLEAIASAKKQKFDIVFLDLHLPDLTGDEVYFQIKATQPEVPIVIVTGQPDSGLLSKILAMGGPVTVIQKPLRFESLNQTLKQLGHKGAVNAELGR